MKRPVLQVAALILIACVVAVVANGFASRTRRLMLPGSYPDALRVPPREPERMAPPPRTETVAPPVVEPVAPVVPTTTTEVGRASARPPEVVTTTTTTTTTTAAAPSAPPERHAEARPAFDLTKYQPHPNVASVDVAGDEVAGLHAAGVLFLDARRTSVYEAGHIAGARSYSVWESDIDDKVNKLFEERSDPTDQNKPIVIYCSGGACEDSHMLAQKLWGIQFNNLYVYKDGFPDWQKRGGAIRTGANP